LEDASQDVLLGYLRLRDITMSHRVELWEEPCMVIRELRILGREVSLGERTEGAFQHRGYGKQLIREAERICKDEYGKKYLFVLSGVGVKPYYRKLGFSDYGVYLRKMLR
jgi:elongator complex protein 3